jgi:hypothetical protein
MITIGYSTRKHNPEYKEYLQKTCMYKQVQIIEKINNGEKSLSEVYNEIIEESTNDIIVLCHDDIEFDTNRWGDKLLKHFDKQSEYGIFGLAGSKYLPNNGQWWFVQQMMFGIVNHKHEGKKWTSSYSKDLHNKVEEVVLVDGLFIAFDKTKIKHKFDETIKGFHFYDLGFSVPNHIDGVKVGVIFDIRVTHLSIGQTNEKWEENRKQFVEKYESNLPLDINSKDISQTFIFVHDQDLIITFEENNKFSNLYNYKYVFLGNRPVDKLSTMDNVIIVRDLEYNIEQYPLFTSYTGWYALWKNNLITTQYINLFEYDVVLDNNIEQNHAKFYYNNAEMIGYVPFLVSNSQFIQNPNWNHAIIPSIKKHYKVDIVNHYVGIMKQNQNALWSSTSNTTFRTDIFNEYMKWFQPIVEDIKETETCGHAHERSISFFASIKRKQLLLTNNLLQHLQLDSHKTQGHFVDQEKQIEKLIGINKTNENAIVVLTRGYPNINNYESLVKRNQLIDEHIISKTNKNFDIVIFNEGNIPEDHQKFISSFTPKLNLIFKDVKNSGLNSAFNNNKNITNMELCPPTPQSSSFGLGYKHMCHFWSIDFFNFLENYKYVIRIDEDCLLTKFNVNILDEMESNNKYFVSPTYQEQDEPYVIVGMEKLWNTFIKENDIIPVKEFKDIKCPYTNLMILNLEYFRNNPLVIKFLDYIDKSHGIYSNRWGDLPIWGMILSTLINENNYGEDDGIAYYHGSHRKQIN